MKISVKPWLECILLSAISVFLYLGVFTIFVFLSPLQLIYLRHGKRDGLVYSFFAFLGIVACLIILFLSMGVVELSVFLANSVTPAIFIGLLAVANYFRYPLGIRSTIIAALSFFAALIAVQYIRNSPLIFSQIYDMVEQLSSFSSTLKVPEFTQLLIDYFSASLSLMLLIPLFASIFVALWVLGRFPDSGASRVLPLLKSYVLPAQMVWVFLLSWACIAVQSFFPSFFLSKIPFLLWNLALSVSFLYFLQGLATLLRILDGYHLKLRQQSRILGIIVILNLLPRIGLLVSGLVVLLGVVEIWITYPSKRVG